MGSILGLYENIEDIMVELKRVYVELLDENWDYPPSSIVRLRERKTHGFDWADVDGFA